MAASPTLFERDLRPAFYYREDFITDADERVLLEASLDNRTIARQWLRQSRLSDNRAA